MICHLATLEWWRAAEGQDLLRPDSLEREGFVHCSHREQLQATADRHFDGHDALVVLMLDEHRIDGVVFEDTSGHGVFPHVYGPLPRTAITTTIRWRRADDGRFPPLPA